MKFIKNDHLTPELPDFFQELAGKRDIEVGIPDVSRRQFFKLSGIAGGGLVLGLGLGSSRKREHRPAQPISAR